MKKPKVKYLIKDMSNINPSNKANIILSVEKSPKNETKKPHGNKGKIFTEECRKKISLASSKRKHSVETKKKISLSKIGKICTKETKKKISITNFIKRKSKPVIVGIDFFESLNAAAKFYNITVKSVRYRCGSDNFTGWNFANEDVIKDKIEEEVNLCV